MYGKFHLKFKKEAIAGRSTLSFMDTTIQAAQDIALSPFTKPHFTSYPLRSLYLAGKNLHEMVDEDNTTTANTGLSLTYTEFQVNGGFSMRDVSEIHMSKNNGVTDEDINHITIMVEHYNTKSLPEEQIQIVLY